MAEKKNFLFTIKQKIHQETILIRNNFLSKLMKYGYFCFCFCFIFSFDTKLVIDTIGHCWVVMLQHFDHWHFFPQNAPFYKILIRQSNFIISLCCWFVVKIWLEISCELHKSWIFGYFKVKLYFSSWSLTFDYNWCSAKILSHFFFF